MKLSIITICYNAESTINDTICSVLHQSYDNIEYIIIDGGSTDNTLNVINKYSDRVHSITSEPDHGIYDAMNKGIKIATGDIIGILNADDIYAHNDVLTNVINTFTASNSDIVSGDLVYVEQWNVDKIKRYYSYKKIKPWKLRFGWMPPHPATFIRKSVYQKAGLYSLDYQIAADYEMFVRLLLVNNFSVSKIPQVLVKMRLGGISTRGIKNSWLLNKEIVKACRDNNIYTNMFLVLSKIPYKLFELL